jgi:integrase
MTRLTDIAIRNLKPKAYRYEVGDPGARGLRVCVFESGKKSYVVRYRFGGSHRKLTLQPGVSLAAARKLAADAMHEVAQGRDPIEAKKEAKSKAATAKLNTLANVCAEYIEREHGKLRSAKQRERWMNRLILPEFSSRQIDSIKRSEIIRWLDKTEKKSGQRSADTVLSILRSIFAWHALRDDYFRSPIVKGMSRYNIKENKRTRILDDVELSKVWQAADGNGGFGAFIKFLLLTSARRNEACGLKFSEIKNGVWTLPASRSKTKVEIVRPLSKAAMQIIKAQPRLGDHVFGVDGRPLTAFSRYKKAFDKRCGVLQLGFA